MPNQTTAGPAGPPPARERWALIRDVAVLQAKLLADALRDLLLAPLALLAAVVDLVRPGGGLFDEVLRLGRRTDRWINLFGHEAAGDSEGEASIDELASKLERRIREKYEAGGVTAQAKEAVDRALDAVSGQRGNRS